MRRGFRVPAVLVVSSLGAVMGCPAADDGTTSVATTGSESSGGETSGPTTSATTTMSTTTTSTTTTETTTESSDAESTTGGESSSSDESSGTFDDTGGNECVETGTMPSCELGDQKSCEAVDVCTWLDMGGGTGYCHAACTEITDETTCCNQYECRWYEGTCDYNGI